MPSPGEGPDQDCGWEDKIVGTARVATVAHRAPEGQRPSGSRSSSPLFLPSDNSAFTSLKPRRLRAVEWGNIAPSYLSKHLPVIFKCEIASPSTYPCQSVGQWVSGDSFRFRLEISELCELVMLHLVILATLVAQHFTPVSEWVSGWAEFRTTVASRLASLFNWENISILDWFWGVSKSENPQIIRSKIWKITNTQKSNNRPNGT